MKWTSMLGVAAVAVALALMAGCSQKTSTCGTGCGSGGCGGGCGGCGAAEKAPAEKAQTTAVEQKNCPVTGEAINTASFTEYKGKKVYFCCKGCIAKFEKDPEKYAANIK